MRGLSLPLGLRPATLGFTLALTLVGCAGRQLEDVPEPAGMATEVADTEPTEQGLAAGDLGGRELRVGTDSTYEPMEFVDESGAIVGMDPDIMAAICRIANCEATFVTTAWDGIFAALKSGEFDVLMSSITILPERETDSGGRFTRPYFRIGQVILVRDDNVDITGVADLATAEVGVQTGTTGDTAAVEFGKVPEEGMNRFDSIPLAIQALRNGDIDAVVLDSTPAEKAVADGVEPKLKTAGAPFTQEEYGILVPESSSEILAAFDLAIGELEASGELAQIAERWLNR